MWLISCRKRDGPKQGPQLPGGESPVCLNGVDVRFLMGIPGWGNTRANGVRVGGRSCASFGQRAELVGVVESVCAAHDVGGRVGSSALFLEAHGFDVVLQTTERTSLVVDGALSLTRFHGPV